MDTINSLVALLVLCQGLGALIGGLTAVWSELAYAHALEDGKIDRAERAHLRVIGHGLRFGMTLLLLSSLGLTIVEYVAEASSQPALTASYWLLVVFVILILSASWALSRRYVSILAGSAIAFTAWWFLVYLTFGRLPTATFGETLFFFLIALLLFLSVLAVVRALIVSPRRVQGR